jgi:hypothetical protein
LLIELEQEWLSAIHDGPIVATTGRRHANIDHDRCGGDLHDRCGGNVHGVHLWKLDDCLPAIALR